MNKIVFACAMVLSLSSQAAEFDITAHSRPEWKNARLESVAENVSFAVGALVCGKSPSALTKSDLIILRNVRCE